MEHRTWLRVHTGSYILAYRTIVKNQRYRASSEIAQADQNLGRLRAIVRWLTDVSCLRRYVESKSRSKPSCIAYIDDCAEHGNTNCPNLNMRKSSDLMAARRAF
jgi:hypothetical protein